MDYYLQVLLLSARGSTAEIPQQRSPEEYLPLKPYQVEDLLQRKPAE